MKHKFLRILAFFCTLAFSCSTFACIIPTEVSIDDSAVGKTSIAYGYDEKDQVNEVVISLKNVTVQEGTTLEQIMSSMKDGSDFTYEIANGMVTSIMNRKNEGNSYWMLYTSDTENANEAWGTYDYDGQKLGSAILGAGSLGVKTGEVYVWAYQTISW